MEDQIQELYKMMSNQFIVSTIGFIVATAGAALAGFFAGKVKAHKKKSDEEKKKEEARIIIEKATARRLIFDAYEDYVIDGKKLTVDRTREITETFEAYSCLGGNGTAKIYYQKIMEKGPFLITD